MTVQYTEESRLPLLGLGTGAWNSVINAAFTDMDQGFRLTVTADESIQAGDIVQVIGSSRIRLAKASNLSYLPAVAIALDTLSEDAEGHILLFGWYDYSPISPSFSASAGKLIYVSDTPGRLTTTPPANSQIMGFVKADTLSGVTRIFLLPDMIINNLFGVTGGFTRTLFFESEINNGNSGVADTIDWTLGNKQKSTLTDNCTYTFDEPAGPCNLTLKMIQTGVSGSGYVPTWPADVYWAGGVAPQLDGGNGSIWIVSLYYDGTDFFGQCSAEMNIP